LNWEDFEIGDVSNLLIASLNRVKRGQNLLGLVGWTIIGECPPKDGLFEIRFQRVDLQGRMRLGK
jgi:hypothetical protein